VLAAKYLCYELPICQSHWSRSLGHELPSPAQTLESWVRIPFEALDVCVRLFCICAVPYAGSALATGSSPVQGALCKKIKKLKNSQGPTKGCRAIDRISYLKWSVARMYFIASLVQVQFQYAVGKVQKNQEGWKWMV
jgi:hypothetical protein